MIQLQAARQLNVPYSTQGMILKCRELTTPVSSQKRNRSETQQSVTEADVIDDVRQKFGLEEEIDT